MAASGVLSLPSEHAGHDRSRNKGITLFRNGESFLTVESGITLGLLKFIYSSDARTCDVLHGVNERNYDSDNTRIIVLDDESLDSDEYDLITQEQSLFESGFLATTSPLALPSLSLLTSSLSKQSCILEKPEDLTSVSTKQQLICEYCHLPFVSKSKFERHKRIHTEERPFICVYCGETFAHHQDLRRHRDELHMLNKSFKCSFCPKTFSTRTELEGHSWRHTGEKSHKCTLCNKCYSTKGNLKHHLNKHVGLVVQKCGFCSQEFTSHSAMECHMTKHTGVRPYKCRHCGNAYATGGQLTLHERIHTGEKPYACTICYKTFRLNSTRVNHERRHVNARPHMCPVCSRSFTQIVNLQQHLETHESRVERQVACPFCDKKIFAGRNMRKHLMRHRELGLSVGQIKSIASGVKAAKDAGTAAGIALEQDATTGSGISSLRCTICTKTFRSKKLLLKHVEKRHYRRPLTADEATRLLTVKETARSFLCDFCQVSLTSYETIRDHIIHVHPQEASRMGLVNGNAQKPSLRHECPSCGCKLATKRALARHKSVCQEAKNSKVKTKKTNAETIRCWLCPKRFPSPEAALSHMITSHNDLDSLPATVEAVAKLDDGLKVKRHGAIRRGGMANGKQDSLGLSYCPHCGKTLEGREAYEIHLLTHQANTLLPMQTHGKPGKFIPILPRPPDASMCTYVKLMPTHTTQGKATLEGSTVGPRPDAIVELNRICRSLRMDCGDGPPRPVDVTQSPVSCSNGVSTATSNPTNPTSIVDSTCLTSSHDATSCSVAARSASNHPSSVFPTRVTSTDSSSDTTSNLSSPFLSALQRLSSSVDRFVTSETSSGTDNSTAVVTSTPFVQDAPMDATTTVLTFPLDATLKVTAANAAALLPAQLPTEQPYACANSISSQVVTASSLESTAGNAPLLNYAKVAYHMAYVPIYMSQIGAPNAVDNRKSQTNTAGDANA